MSRALSRSILRLIAPPIIQYRLYSSIPVVLRISPVTAVSQHPIPNHGLSAKYSTRRAIHTTVDAIHLTEPSSPSQEQEKEGKRHRNEDADSVDKGEEEVKVEGKEAFEFDEVVDVRQCWRREQISGEVMGVCEDEK